MNQLINRIQRRIAERKFCTIFENEISRHWPYGSAEREEQKAAIVDFAKEHGWKATILDPGIRVTFRPRAEAKP